MKFDEKPGFTGAAATTDGFERHKLKPSAFPSTRSSAPESSILFNTPHPKEKNSMPPMMNTGSNETILIVDDSIEICHALSKDIISLGYTPLTAATHKQALRYLQDAEENVSTAIVDLVLGREDGLALLEELSVRWPNMRRILMSGYVLPTTLDLVRSCGRAHAVMSKPWSRESLASVIQGEKDK